MLRIEGESDRNEDETERDEDRRAVDGVVLLAERRPADAARSEEHEDAADRVAVAFDARRPAFAEEEAGQYHKAAGQIETERQRSLDSRSQDRSHEEREGSGHGARAQDDDEDAAGG